MSNILQSGTPRDAFDRSTAIAMHHIHPDGVHPFGSHGPLNLTIVDIAYDPAIKVVAPPLLARPAPTRQCSLEPGSSIS